jgi:putative ABC transport system permease protein
VRSALGARPVALVGLVARDGLALVMAGLGIGLVAAIAIARALESLLFHTSAWEPAVYLVVVGVLLLIALVSGAVPAWRATKVSPMQALRTDG